MPHVELEIAASPRDVYKVITDYESYPEFRSEIRNAEILEVTDRFVVVGYKIRLGRPLSYRLKYVETPYRLVKWTYISGDIRDYNGSWTLSPSSGGGTRVELDMNLRLGRLASKAVGKVVAGFRAGVIARRFKEHIEAGMHLREASLDRMLEEYERGILYRYLRRCDWDLREAALMLSMSERKLVARIKKYSLKRDRD